jgi:hypothetical protein
MADEVDQWNLWPVGWCMGLATSTELLHFPRGRPAGTGWIIGCDDEIHESKVSDHIGGYAARRRALVVSTPDRWRPVVLVGHHGTNPRQISCQRIRSPATLFKRPSHFVYDLRAGAGRRPRSPGRRRVGVGPGMRTTSFGRAQDTEKYDLGFRTHRSMGPATHQTMAQWIHERHR